MKTPAWLKYEFKKPTPEAEERQGRIGCWAISIIGLCWLLLVIVASDFQPIYSDPYSDRELDKAKMSLLLACSEVFSQTPGTVRIEPRALGNVIVYLPKKDYENVPFPDRKAAMARIGEVWCSTQSRVFRPRVWVKDIKTGDALDNYGCGF